MTDDTRNQRQPVAAESADDCRVLEFGPHNLLQCGPHNTLRCDAPGSVYLMADDFSLIGTTIEEAGIAEAVEAMREQWPVRIGLPPAESD